LKERRNKKKNERRNKIGKEGMPDMRLEEENK
jgi:hypothetical protein